MARPATKKPKRKRTPKSERLRDRIQMPTRDELMHPKPEPWWTCGRCAGPAIFFPSPYVERKPGSTDLVPTGNGTLVCPHRSTMPKEQWPSVSHDGTIVKACGCGRAECPVNVVGAPLPAGQAACR